MAKRANTSRARANRARARKSAETRRKNAEKRSNVARKGWRTRRARERGLRDFLVTFGYKGKESTRSIDFIATAEDRDDALTLVEQRIENQESLGFMQEIEWSIVAEEIGDATGGRRGVRQR